MADNNTIQQFNIKANAEVQTAISKLEKLSATMKSIDKSLSMAGATQSLKQFESELSKMSNDIKRRTQEIAKSMSPNELRQAIKQNLRTLNSAQAQMTMYSKNGLDSQMYRNAKTDFEKATAQVGVFQKRLEEITKTAPIKMNFSYSNPNAIKRMAENMKEENKEITDIGSNRVDEISSFMNLDYDKQRETMYGGFNYATPQDLERYEAQAKLLELGKTAELTGNKFSALGFRVREAFSQSTAGLSLSLLKSNLKEFGQALPEIYTKLKRVGSAIASFGRKVLSAITPFKMFNHQQKLTSISSTLLGRAFSRLARMFRIMVTRMVIRAFITNIREGFQNIAQYSEEVNQAFSRIGQSAKTLYNSMATALTPLIQALTPYIVKFLDMITSAFTKVAEFISALTGKSYFIKATKFNYDYAKSLDKSTKSANKNTKATNKNTKAKKKNKNETIGIDRLNVIAPDKNKNANNNNGNGNKNNGANVKDMFTKAKVSADMKKFADKLANAIKKGEWYKVGKIISERLDDQLKKINWDKIKKTAGNIGKNIANFFNGIFANLSLAETIGNTFAQALNTAIRFAYNFLVNFDFKQFGLFIGTSLQNAIDNFEWGTLGQSIGLYLNGIKDTIDGFWNGYEVGSFGTNLATLLNTALETTDWGGLATTLSNTITNTLDEITTFIEELSTEDISEAISTFITNIDYDKIATSFTDGMATIKTTIVDTVVDTVEKALKKGWNKGWENFKNWLIGKETKGNTKKNGGGSWTTKKFKGDVWDAGAKGAKDALKWVNPWTWLQKYNSLFFASGGYPDYGSMFVAGEKGAELVGTINGKTGVASQGEITGIRESIVESGNAQIQMLQEQNNLLRGILAKDYDLNLDGEKITKKVNKINDRKGYRIATT